MSVVFCDMASGRRWDIEMNSQKVAGILGTIVAAAVLYVASDRAGFVTGQLLSVDGGTLL